MTPNVGKWVVKYQNSVLWIASNNHFTKLVLEQLQKTAGAVVIKRMFFPLGNHGGIGNDRIRLKC